MQEAGLRNAHLQMAMLDGAKLQAANLAGAQLRGVDFSWAHMHRAIFFDMAAGGAELQGAILRNTELHEADLRKAQLQGVGYEPFPGETFAERMTRSIGRELSDETASTLRAELKQHIGKPRRHQLPDDSGAITKAYTEEEAKRWIAEYEEAMSQVPGEDS